VSAAELPLLELYERMAVIRAFEERVALLYRNSDIPGFIHTSLGQEAVAVGVGAALIPGDHISSTHRGHGHCLARGADVDAAMAELFGKATGLCKGKGGSMHIADPALGILGANAIVGASIPLATGAALSSKLLGRGTISVSFFGDGAVNQGVLHEALNLAAIWELPVLFVCENNTYAEFSDSREMTRRPSLEGWAASLGVRGGVVDGNDVEAVLVATAEAAATARAGGGPFVLEALTYRWHGHYEGDVQRYKPADEAAAWRERDPLVLTATRLEASGVPRASLDAILAEATARIDRAEAFARSSPYPEPEEVFADVYGD
jgi:TPP-dependent pyruvate/acetoin dehydrogenase alpha subunit